MPRLGVLKSALFLVTAYVPATLGAQHTYGAGPGTLNFTQGQVNIDGRPLEAGVLPAGRQLQVGETLATARGSADILLAPGALLRLGDNATVSLVAVEAHRTEVRVEQGRVNVSVNTVRGKDLLLVDTPNGQTQILSRGLYSFNTGTNTVRVFNGEAFAFPGADTSSDVKPVTVKEGHELILGSDRAKAVKFDRETEDDDLLPWTGPKETRAALGDSSLHHDSGSGWADADAGGYGYADYPAPAYGFAGGYGYGSPYYGYDSPYAWGPYGFYGYPFFGVGFGYFGGEFFRGPLNNYPPIKGPGRFGGTAHGGSSLARPAGAGFTGRPGGAAMGGAGFRGGLGGRR